MISVGGNSYNNGIKFTANKYKVNFETFSDSTKIFLRRNDANKKQKILDIMYKIPLGRGLTSLIKENKLIAMLIIFDFVQKIFFNNMKSKSSFLPAFNIFTTIAFFAILTITLWYIISKVFKNIKSTWQYHGAEHKVIYANYEGLELTLENCRKSPRISDNCGTMFVCLIIFTFTTIKLFTFIFRINIWSSIYFLIVYVISYELFLLDRNFPVLRWIFKLGYLFQKYIFTREPSDFQLNQAIEAFKILERAETGKIPDNEISKLLEEGNQSSILNKIF